MDHSFSTYAKFSENLTCAYQGVRNVSFSENFTNILNEWSPSDRRLIQNEIGQTVTVHWETQAKQ